jgi:hypothetical protein
MRICARIRKAERCILDFVPNEAFPTTKSAEGHMSTSLSTLLAAWLIAGMCIGAVSLLQRALPMVEAIGRSDPAIPASTRPVPKPSTLGMMFGRTDPEDAAKTIIP